MSTSPTKKRTLEALHDEIFGSAASRHGMEEKYLRQWFKDVEMKLMLLNADQVSAKDESLYQETRAFRDEITRALQHPLAEKIWGKRGMRTVAEGLEARIRDANAVLDSGLSFMDITIFYQVSDFGRKVFDVHRRSSTQFISDRLFKLAKMICDNYPAYSTTLKGHQL